MEQEAAAFEGSDFLKGLRERSALSRDKNKKDLLEKYCYRQAEMGVGDVRILPFPACRGHSKATIVHVHALKNSLDAACAVCRAPLDTRRYKVRGTAS